MIIEWNPLSLPLRFITHQPQLFGPRNVELVVSRDDELTLVTEVKTGLVPRDANPPPAGSAWVGDTLEVVSHDRQLAGSLHGYRTLNHVLTADSLGQGRTQLTGIINSFDVEFTGGDAQSITEWLANVPSRIWPRTTARKALAKEHRTRGSIVLQDNRPSEGFSRDHLELSLGLPDVSVLHFGSVDTKRVAENESIVGSGFIEFHRGESGLPSAERRHSIQRALEFLFGCGFGVLGSTEFDVHGQPLRGTISSAMIAGGQANPLPPVMLDEELANGVDERLVANFVLRYLEREPAYDLNRTVWLFLHSRDAPLDMASGYLGAAFEILRRSYYSQPQNESRSQLFSKAEWAAVAAALSSAAADTATRVGFPESQERVAELRKKLPGLNAVSGTRLNRQLLDDLKLSHGDVEKEALQSRNDAAHGNPLEPDEYTDVLRSFRALHTLFARTLFAILGIDARYIDYSSLGFPARPLREAQGDR